MSDESGSNGGGGDDLSGLSGFFFYVFIVHPATAWILRPGRFERKKSIIYAIGFLALLAAVKTGELFIRVFYARVLCPLLNKLICSPRIVESHFPFQEWKCKPWDQTTIPS